MASNQNNIYTANICTKVLESLDRVSTESLEIISEIVNGTPLLQIIQIFNQQSNDLFQMLSHFIKKYKLNDNKFKINGYRNLFNNAISVNVRLPIDKFTLTILSYAADIYSRNDTVFLDMKVEETVIKVGNEFEIFSSDIFKDAWKIINNEDKEEIRNVIMSLTMYSHAYFCQIINRMTKTSSTHK